MEVYIIGIAFLIALSIILSVASTSTGGCKSLAGAYATDVPVHALVKILFNLHTLVGIKV